MGERVRDDEARASGKRQPEAYFGVGMLIAIGAGIGLVVGVLLDALALGVACGAGLGTVTGAVLEAARARK